jgi:phosphoglycolate phosphatase-like HAD superfamily hydrolase
VFDFDGVLVDGMDEYWWAARSAFLELVAADGLAFTAPDEIPDAFRCLRPRIHKGWEMVLVAAELGRRGAAAAPDPGDSSASLIAPQAAASRQAYERAVEVALARWRWTPERLQRSLEAVRQAAIRDDRAAWLRRHRFYPGVPERLARLAPEGADWLVLTTKGAAFAAELLAAAGLEPAALYGHEHGSKPEVLRRLRDQRRPLWFVEDRRPTLEQVRATPGLESVRCYLVSWGYLAPEDADEVAAAGLRWLEPDRFAAPLADWP